MSIFSATMLLILTMNPLGSLPLFLSALKPIDPKRHFRIIVREAFFAYLVLITFMFFGQAFLRSVQISEQALGISGGIIMFLIAIRMIFPEEKHRSDKISALPTEPFFVPLALPITAGPAALTSVMLLAAQYPGEKHMLFIIISIAALSVVTILLGGRYLSKHLGEKGIIALERLSGMLLTAMAVQMFLSGVNSYFRLHY